MKRFLGIFATARLDDKVEALQKRVDELEAARQKTDEAK